MQGRIQRSRSRSARLAPWVGAAWLMLAAGAWAATSSPPAGRVGAPQGGPPQVPTIPPDLIAPSGPRPATPEGEGKGLKMEPKPKEAMSPAQRERCNRATYIVRQANELGDESPLTVSYVQRALDICPNNPAANTRMGIIQYNKKNVAAARKAFQQALRDGAQMPEVYFNLGMLARKEKKYAEALSYFRRAVDLNPRDAGALYNLGIMQARAQERTQALESFRKAIQENPRMAEAHFFLGALLQEQGDRGEAEKELQESVRLNPKLALPHIYLAAIREAEGKSQAAQEELRRAMRLNPASVQVGYSLDDFYAKEGGSNNFIAQLRDRPRSQIEVATLPGEKSPGGGGKAASQGFGPRREAKEVPAPGKKPAASSNQKARERPARRETPQKRTSSVRRREPAGRIYRVRPGDTLSGIAARHGTSLKVLARMNRERIEHPSMLEPGQKILVPAPSRKRAPRRRVRTNSRAKRPSVRRKTSPARRTFRTHRVRRGETLARIARRYRTSIAILMRLNRNRIEHPSLLRVGQVIRVPAPRRSRRRAPARQPATKKPAKN